MAKDLQERNHLVRWGLLIGITFFGCATALILFIDYEVIRHPQIIKDHHFQIVLFVLAICLTVYFTSQFIRLLARYLNHKYLQRFESLPELSAFKESCAKVYFPEKKYDHLVLLFHGFTASPQEFQFLTPYLEKAGIPYIAPIVTGFGLSSTHLLSQTQRHDWYRIAMEQYDKACSVADRVSIIGHSMGGILATFVAMHRPVHHLILSGPGLYSVPADLKYKRLLSCPVISDLYIKAIPYLPKPIRKGRKTTSDTLDISHTHSMFQYLAIPINAVKQVFSAQDDVDVAKVQCDHLSVLYGRHDLTVDMSRLFTHMDEQHMTYDKYCFNRSAHNVLEDYEKDFCAETVITILTAIDTCDVSSESDVTMHHA